MDKRPRPKRFGNPVQVRFDDDLARRLEKEAENRRMPIAELVREAVAAHLPPKAA